MGVKAKSKVHVRPPQVFVNFRGDELRENFVNQLVRALRKGEINVFIDVHELKGRTLKTRFTRIQNSRIALAIFSKRYCESEWCLDELAMMYKQMNEGKLVVIPIFYNVTANDVKRACNPGRVADVNGEEKEFTTLFKKMKEKHANDPQKINRWEVALKSVTERIGLSTEVYGKTLVKTIVVEVRRHLGICP
ncbi:BnaC02g31400D [Brassica napus]|uniref:BnaC02g31400D protein n=2 Tax=Brassica TaxID=3705 RepID=A0A078HH35_BRANA|nr:PREDICTED: vesicle-associated protein 1-4 [Brassica oleracea var. oleracea]CDY36719.1 BnaC02g31400D [Brassica napus]